jgi:hypothetical protein
MNKLLIKLASWCKKTSTTKRECPVRQHPPTDRLVGGQIMLLYSMALAAYKRTRNNLPVAFFLLREPILIPIVHKIDNTQKLDN